MKILAIAVLVVFLAINSSGSDKKSDSKLDKKEEIVSESLTFQDETAREQTREGVFVNSEGDKVFVTIAIEFPTPNGSFEITKAKRDGNTITLSIKKSSSKSTVAQVITLRSRTVSFEKQALGKNPTFKVNGLNMSEY